MVGTEKFKTANHSTKFAILVDQLRIGHGLSCLSRSVTGAQQWLTNDLERFLMIV